MLLNIFQNELRVIVHFIPISLYLRIFKKFAYRIFRKVYIYNVAIELKRGDIMEFLEPVIRNLPLQAEVFVLSTAIIIFIILFFIIAVLIAVWIYRDAERRGMSGVLWLLVALVAGIFGLIIYLIVRKDKKPVYQRTQAQHPPPHGYPPPQESYQYPPPQHGANFCKNCGSRLEPGARFCPGCGQRV